MPKVECTVCGKKVEFFDIGEEGAYYDKDKNFVCFTHFLLQLESFELTDFHKEYLKSQGIDGK